MLLDKCWRIFLSVSWIAKHANALKTNQPIWGTNDQAQIIGLWAQYVKIQLSWKVHNAEKGEEKRNREWSAERRMDIAVEALDRSSCSWIIWNY